MFPIEIIIYTYIYIYAYVYRYVYLDSNKWNKSHADTVMDNETNQCTIVHIYIYI